MFPPVSNATLAHGIESNTVRLIVVVDSITLLPEAVMEAE